VATTDEFYQLARGVDWREHMDPNGTLACEFTGKHPAITNTHFGALKPEGRHLRPAARYHQAAARRSKRSAPTWPCTRMRSAAW
jgi:23S rRNA G2445 N2-methylase RlmL